VQKLGNDLLRHGSILPDIATHSGPMERRIVRTTGRRRALFKSRLAEKSTEECPPELLQ
jgi:hypothetical protein